MRILYTILFVIFSFGGGESVRAQQSGHSWGLSRDDVLLESFLDATVFKSLGKGYLLTARKYRNVEHEAGVFVAKCHKGGAVIGIAEADISFTRRFWVLHASCGSKVDLISIDALSKMLLEQGHVKEQSREIDDQMYERIEFTWNSLFERLGSFNAFNFIDPRWSFSRSSYVNIIYHKDTTEDNPDHISRSMLQMLQAFVSYVKGDITEERVESLLNEIDSKAGLKFTPNAFPEQPIDMSRIDQD